MPPNLDPNAQPAGTTAEDELGGLAAELDAILGAPAPAAGPSDMPVDPMADDPSAAPPTGPDALPAGDSPAQPLVDALTITPEHAQELLDAAAVYPPTQGMDPQTLADTLSSDVRLLGELEARIAPEEEYPEEQEMFSLDAPDGDMVVDPEPEEDEPSEPPFK